MRPRRIIIPTALLLLTATACDPVQEVRQVRKVVQHLTVDDEPAADPPAVVAVEPPADVAEEPTPPPPLKPATEPDEPSEAEYSRPVPDPVKPAADDPGGHRAPIETPTGRPSYPSMDEPVPFRNGYRWRLIDGSYGPLHLTLEAALANPPAK